MDNCWVVQSVQIRLLKKFAVGVLVVKSWKESLVMVVMICQTFLPWKILAYHARSQSLVLSGSTAILLALGGSK